MTDFVARDGIPIDYTEKCGAFMLQINYIDFADFLEVQRDRFGGKLALVPFFYEGRPLSVPAEGTLSDAASGCGAVPRWGMTTLAAGSMRFSWETQNPNRALLDQVFGPDRLCPVKLIHSHTVYPVKNPADTSGLEGDGIITADSRIVPSVTVADCVPIFLYDVASGAFGALHSGWKGTGICVDALRKMTELYGTRPENVCVAIGPHIESCYFVDKARALWFSENFGPECVELRAAEDNAAGSSSDTAQDLPYRLSLLKANLLALEKAGIRGDNVVAARECTFSARYSDGLPIFGSCRRQTAGVSGLPLEEFCRLFTVQAAFVCF